MPTPAKGKRFVKIVSKSAVSAKSYAAIKRGFR